MKRSTQTKPDFTIDESTHRESPTILQRIRNALFTVLAGAIFVQVILSAFRSGTILFLTDNILFIGFLIFCAVMGFFIGDKFAHTLNKESGLWWNLWNYWK